jgi:hypothetical protein
VNGANISRCKRSEEKEICRALPQPLQALWQTAWIYPKVPPLPNLLPAVVALGGDSGRYQE